ncbi:hypothetical protein HYZ97_01280 [Candidatus Pacearchaeota archaeon]|nr:hypothetical protein [Candidatus Pacearchaeota archaeon]
MQENNKQFLKLRSNLWKDIARAIVNHNLMQYAGAVQKDARRKAELSRHPNVQVSGLPERLEATVLQGS